MRFRLVPIGDGGDIIREQLVLPTGTFCSEGKPTPATIFMLSKSIVVSSIVTCAAVVLWSRSMIEAAVVETGFESNQAVQT